MTLTGVAGLGFEEASLRSVGRGRRAVVIVLGVILAAVACAIIGAAFVRGSWWYAYGTDRALDDESLARLEAIRDEVDAGGAAPQAVMWLNAALEPDTHPTDVRTYLLTAQEALEAADNPRLAEAAGELRAILETIRPSYFKRVIEITPYSVPTSE